jgi:hypothetical protein
MPTKSVSFPRKVPLVATRARRSEEERDYGVKGAPTPLPNFSEFDAGAAGVAIVLLHPPFSACGLFYGNCWREPEPAQLPYLGMGPLKCSGTTPHATIENLPQAQGHMCLNIPHLSVVRNYWDSFYWSVNIFCHMGLPSLCCNMNIVFFF